MLTEPMKPSPKTIVIVALLYAGTWVGGYLSHADQLRSSAEKLYAEARADEVLEKDLWKEVGFSEPPKSRLRPQGPKTRISWSFPVLPGILVADSFYVMGPRWGRGGVKVIVYYGLGSWTIGPIWGWIA